MYADEGLVSRLKSELHEAHRDRSGDEDAHRVVVEKRRTEELMLRSLLIRGEGLLLTLEHSDEKHSEWLRMGSVDDLEEVGIYVSARPVVMGGLAVDMKLQEDSDPGVQVEQKGYLVFYPGFIHNCYGTVVEPNHERWDDAVAIVGAIEAQLSAQPAESA
ncbi:MAG TPA: hypothetical protein VMR16_04075 [Candidatus Saccharimonadales bacterium]|nr:hypothetical protein [Candidatus Saccharimonadales bacterium]